jgi:protein required for attachment to host cells
MKKRCKVICQNELITKSELNIMKNTWVLITDAEHARCFERDAASHSLKELDDFVHPHVSLQGKAEGGDLTGEAGKGHGRTGHAGTQFEPHTEAHAKERANFARELAAYLNKGVAEQRCKALVLIATSPMLGELRTHLSHESEKTVLVSMASDLTHYTGQELEKRVNDALLP